MIFWTVKYTNTQIQRHKYTNTLWWSAGNTQHVLYFRKGRGSRTSKMIFWTVKNTKIQEMQCYISPNLKLWTTDPLTDFCTVPPGLFSLFSLWVQSKRENYQTVLCVSETNLSGRGRLKEKEEARGKNEEKGEAARRQRGKTEKSHLQIQKLFRDSRGPQQLNVGLNVKIRDVKRCTVKDYALSWPVLQWVSSHCCEYYYTITTWLNSYSHMHQKAFLSE